jgi:hypothetical protein
MGAGNSFPLNRFIESNDISLLTEYFTRERCTGSGQPGEYIVILVLSDTLFKDL